MRIAQIVVSLLLVFLVLIQERSSGTSGLFGGGGGGAPYQTRRGMEKFIYGATIGIGIAFVIIAVLNRVL